MDPAQASHMDPFTEEDFAELATWLAGESMPEDALDITMLEGFLTAIVIGPRTPPPAEWLPRVWGASARPPAVPPGSTPDRSIALIVGFYNELVELFEHDADSFEPTFFQREVDGEMIVIPDEWCMGFIKGMDLDRPAWSSLQSEQPVLFEPIELFGTEAGWARFEEGDEQAMHADAWPKIAPAILAIHQYWLKRREAVVRSTPVH